MSDAASAEREIAGWLVAIGYPFDFGSLVPIPERFRVPLVEAWFAKDGIEGEDIGDWFDSCAEEGGWR